MAEIKNIYEDSARTQEIYPITHEKAVIDNNGTTAGTKFQMITDLVNQKQMAVGAVQSDLIPTEGSTHWVTSGGVYDALSSKANLYGQYGNNENGSVTQKFLTAIVKRDVLIDNSIYPIVKCNIYQSKWNDVGNNSRKSIFIPLLSGYTYKLKAIYRTYYTVVTDTTVVSGQTPAFAPGYSDRIQLSENAVADIVGVTGQYLWAREDDSLNFAVTYNYIADVRAVNENIFHLVSDIDEADIIAEYSGRPFPKPTSRIGFSKYMDVHSYTGRYPQGSAAFDKWLFEFDDGLDYINIYNLETRTFYSQITRTAARNDHCSSAMFTNIYLNDGDEFPLLLLSGMRDDRSYLCRLTLTEGVFSFEIVQTISYPSSFGYAMLIDNDTSSYWWFGGVKLVRTAIPAIKDGEGNIISSVTITNEDKIEEINAPSSIYGIINPQGGIIVNGWLYADWGVPSWGNKIWLTATDLWHRSEQDVRVNLTQIFKPNGSDAYEPEGMFLYDSHLFISFKTIGFYKILL